MPSTVRFLVQHEDYQHIRIADMYKRIRQFNTRTGQHFTFYHDGKFDQTKEVMIVIWSNQGSNDCNFSKNTFQDEN